MLVAVACAAREPLRSPLALERPIEAIAADLEVYVPTRMAEAGVPGLSLAIVRGGEVVFADGWGTRDRFGGEPVTPDTVFQVASNGKPVAAYLAVLLLQDGVFELDRALDDYLDEPYLRPSPYLAEVTLRRALTHTAGLTNRIVPEDRRITERPGARFSYAGVGFGYLAHVFEHVTRESFDALVERRVLAPLKMTRSGYLLDADLEPDLASGHVPLWLLLAPFAALLAVSLAVVFAAGWGVLRFVSGRALARRDAQRLALLALALALALGVAASFTFGAIAMAYGVAACIHLALAWRAGRGSPRRRAVALTAGALLLAVFAVQRVPFSAPLPERAHAAYSFLSTAPDLARFLAELSRPALLGPELTAELRRAQVSVNERVSWGLGIGLQHTSDGDALFHWGQNLGYESLMVVFPEQQIGVVVLTNATGGLDIVRDIAHRAIGGEHYGYWRF